MTKNVRRGRTGSVICASCGKVTRRDRAVYTYKEGIKVYYCPDCAKKVHVKLYKGAPHYVKKRETPTAKRKFIIYQNEQEETVPREEKPPEETAQETTSDNQQNV